MSKRILCFGDSNTWGFLPEGQPEDGSYRVRYPFGERWTGILAGILGEGYRVIEEGLNGRTTAWDDPIAPYRNALRYIDACVETHAPLDMIVIMLGTNDLKPRIAGRAYDSAEGAGALVERIKHNHGGRDNKPPRILIAAPCAIGSHIEKSFFADEFGGIRSREESLKAPKYLAAIADALGCEFLDGVKYTKTGPDAIHLDADSHKKLAKALGQKIKKIL
jgi:lysophospholipase L1-like esterase